MLIKKILVIGIIILFLGTCITPSVAIDNVNKSFIPISNGNTLYVGGSGPGNYTTIQGAINHASDGDTVFVYNGTYYEEVNVKKRINLIGESNYDTIINSLDISDTVLVITSDYIEVQGFTITSRNSSIKTTYGIKISSSNCNISYCNIMYNSLGIAFYGNSNHNTIYRNNIKNSSYGIYLGFMRGGSYFNIIKQNNFIEARLIFSLSFCNHWISNYYDSWIGIGPKIIWGYGFVFPWVNFDWHPAKEPYDIGV